MLKTPEVKHGKKKMYMKKIWRECLQYIACGKVIWYDSQ